MSGTHTSSDFARCMPAVAIELLGEPNKELSTRDELRWGTRGSMCVDCKKGTWCDHEAGGTGGGVLDLLKVKKGLEKEGALAWLRERKHLTDDDAGRPRIVATYDYTDATGELIFQVCRFMPKDFRQRRPDGQGGWVWKTAGMKLCLYRLPELLAAVAAGRTIYVAEGEKSVDLLRGLGLPATCSPGGAGKWRPHYSPALTGADVVLLPDNDEPGRDHAAKVAAALKGFAKTVRMLALPGLPEKGDAYDWIAAGGTRDALETLLPEAAEPPKGATAKSGIAAEAEIPTLHGQSLTEDGIALAFAAIHKDTLRFDHTRGAWFVWNGNAWRQDETKLAFSWSRRTCREIANQAKADGKLLSTLAKAATAASVERFAQSDPALTATADIWDRDPFLLGTPDGTVDLRTGNVRTAQPDEYITKLTAVAPALSPSCPMWDKFLLQTTSNDTDLIRFLRQWFGYCLTGDTREHALLFGHGPGGNGKGVMLNTIAGIMGDYCRQSAMDSFTASHGDRHPTDLAMLRGARMVCASETEEGRAWAESRIKQMTGGDVIAARFMRQDFFEYKPQFKLFLIGNHKPILKNVDEAARRRFNMVPFNNKPTSPDKGLEIQLRNEWPGILRWMIEGCLDWQKHGLARPKIVADATADYFESQDFFGRWLADCAILDPSLESRPAVLLASFRDWCAANGEPLSDNRIMRGMIERTPGLRYVTNRGVRSVRGIGLIPNPNRNEGAGVHCGA
jgi:putative DNA primase/helicase